MEKSNIEILQEFAERSNRKLYFQEGQYPLSTYRQIPRFKRTAYIPNNTNETCYFVLSGDPYNSVDKLNTFCGVYFPLEIPLSTKINLREKNILDKINPFLSSKILKTGYANFDSLVVATGNSVHLVEKYLHDVRFNDVVVDTLSKSPELNFSINESNVDFVPALKNKSHFAIINPQQWVLDSSTIEEWFKKIEIVRQTIIKVKY